MKKRFAFITSIIIGVSSLLLTSCALNEMEPLDFCNEIGSIQDSFAEKDIANCGFDNFFKVEKNRTWYKATSYKKNEYVCSMYCHFGEHFPNNPLYSWLYLDGNDLVSITENYFSDSILSSSEEHFYLQKTKVIYKNGKNLFDQYSQNAVNEVILLNKSGQDDAFRLGQLAIMNRGADDEQYHFKKFLGNLRAEATFDNPTNLHQTWSVTEAQISFSNGYLTKAFYKTGDGESLREIKYGSAHFFAFDSINCDAVYVHEEGY